jgi:hypothetical protein
MFVMSEREIDGVPPIHGRHSSGNERRRSAPMIPRVSRRPWAGTGTFMFVNENNGVFLYSIDGVSQQKRLTRYVCFPDPVSVCR